MKVADYSQKVNVVSVICKLIYKKYVSLMNVRIYEEDKLQI